MSKHSGEAFTTPTDDAPAPDVKGFDPRKWARGTAPVTRSVAVCGRPDLMGHIEALKASAQHYVQNWRRYATDLTSA